jgi:hypothetical protein
VGKQTQQYQMSGKRNATIQMSGADTEHGMRGKPALQQYQLSRTDNLISIYLKIQKYMSQKAALQRKKLMHCK